ncbi:helix-turn-helix domain-containing protein [Kaistia dalseonensis]|uniref:AraC-like DNA-binding protein n=1 Tax=Kaistia dalseonensis TaxID=410840 RepID=A0ABU0H0R9_9HYPH|nr:helix-turn-helix domain-containing protein [Kaistia dalseonensis]MCX5493346.1 helix-turn-helix domain-containing protein [Kaistia dalseonensis]MDQ0435903.1 AraC-like DNA-binding protein [Kaistia dalseonensis]
MPSRPKKLFLSSDMIDPKIRDEYWRDVSSVIFEIDPWDINGDTGFRGTVVSRPFGSLTVGNTTFNDQKVWRTRRTVVRSALEVCIVQLVISGESQGDFNGADVAIRPGDIMIHDMTQVMDSQVTAGARISIVIPRSELQKCVSRQTLHGIVLRGEWPTTRLLADYIKGLDKILTDLPVDAVPAAEEALMILLASAINGREAGLRDDLPVNLPMKQRIIDYIDRSIMDPELGPQAIMKRFRLSRSHLYRTFAAEGGVAKLIRDRRLDSAYRMLSSRSTNMWSNKEILLRCGLPDGVHFARIFKERFGVLPNEARNHEILEYKERVGTSTLHSYLGDYVSKL